MVYTILQEENKTMAQWHNGFEHTFVGKRYIVNLFKFFTHDSALNCCFYSFCTNRVNIDIGNIILGNLREIR